MRALAQLVLDAVLVLAFAAIGRRSHAHGLDLLGIVGTAVPFWAGLVVGWGVTIARGRLPLTVRRSVPMWLLTVATGHLARLAVGTGTAFSFVVVSLVALAVLLLLPRAVLHRDLRD